MSHKYKILLLDFVGELFSNTEKSENSQLVLPVGLMYLSSYLKSKRGDLEIRLIKSYVDFHGDDALIDIITDFQPTIIGIRALSLDTEALLSTVQAIRRRYVYPKHIIVLGGPITNAETVKVFGSKLFDFVVVNEGERSFHEIVSAHIEGREVQKDVVGIVHDPTNARGDLIEELDELPFPDYSLIDFKKYDQFLNYGYNRARQGVLVTSRGCPYRCTYCHNIMGRKARLRSADNVFDEIEHLYNTYHIRDFFIVDDIFNINYARSMNVFDKIIASGLNLSLYFPNGIRGDIIDRPYIDKMVDAGTKYVSFAVETASPRLQRMMKKHVKLEKLTDLIHYTCDKNIMVNCFFMFGMPTETVDDAIQTLEYAENLDKLHFPYVFFARYYHGTEMYQQALEGGFTDEMIHNSVNQLYHDIGGYSTPTLPKEFIQYVKNYFLYRVIFNKRRIEHMLNVEEKYHTPEQTIDVIKSMYNVEVKAPSDFLEYARQLSTSTMARKYGQPFRMPEPVG